MSDPARNIRAPLGDAIMIDATETAAPAGYRLGDPIELHDLLALPPDGRRYDRDEQGRLILMSPDDAPTHRWPMNVLQRRLCQDLDQRWEVLLEPGVALEPILALDGTVLPPSRLGRKTLGPDLAVFEGPPRFVRGRPEVPDSRYQVFAPERLRVAVEFLSRRTQRSDLGLGEADAVDRWRTYLANGIDEYWLINAGSVPCGLPARSALLLRREGEAWRPLGGEALRPAPGAATLRGLTPISSGVVRSRALGAPFDLDAFWSSVDRATPQA